MRVACDERKRYKQKSFKKELIMFGKRKLF